MALVDVSVVEQRYQTVLMVLGGSRVVDVAARFGARVHLWLAAYRAGGDWPRNRSVVPELAG